ncbi:MAG: hypothetical protein WBZ29_17865 [Methanocella sp.]
MSGLRILATADRIPRLVAPLAVFVFCLLVLLPVSAAAESSVHGNVYDWSTFNTVNNAIVKVYSLPDMSLINQMVTGSDGYRFSLSQGTYMIMASSGTPGTPDEITAIENVTVPATGERIIDLVLFPRDNIDDLSGYVEDNATATPSPTESPTASPVPTPQPGRGDWAPYMGAGAILLAIIAIAAGLLFLRYFKPKPPARPPPAKEEPVAQPHQEIQPASSPEEQKQEPQEQSSQMQAQQPSQQPQPTTWDQMLPQDCREVLAIMEKNGGRITQLDLRKALPYSEAKVSLIVSDLESRGLVKKIKKGRGNVLIMNRPGQPDEKKGSSE